MTGNWGKHTHSYEDQVSKIGLDKQLQNVVGQVIIAIIIGQVIIGISPFLGRKQLSTTTISWYGLKSVIYKAQQSLHVSLPCVCRYPQSGGWGRPYDFPIVIEQIRFYKRSSLNMFQLGQKCRSFWQAIKSEVDLQDIDKDSQKKSFYHNVISVALERCSWCHSGIG